jgi:predicted RNA-binding Zn-ribbon protein involved in translation (DUF1610 family)
LSNLGFDDRGTEIMYDPITGKQYEARILIGNQVYTRQKRMVDFLRTARQGGAKEPFSRQPVGGKDRDGGLRFAEMESRATQASGAMNGIVDTMVTQAAPKEFPICDKCGEIAYRDPSARNLYRCDACGQLDPASSHLVSASYFVQLLRLVCQAASLSFQIDTDGGSCSDAINPTKFEKGLIDVMCDYNKAIGGVCLPPPPGQYVPAFTGKVILPDLTSSSAASTATPASTTTAPKKKVAKPTK